MSNLRTPSASGFYGSRSASRSAANRLLQQCVQEALAKKRASTLNVTPARSQTSMPRRTSNFYGPGVFLEEVNRTEDENNSESEDGGPDFDFDFGDSRQKDGSSLPHDHERCHSPEIPLHNPVSDFEVRRVDSYSGQNSHTTGHQNEVMPMLQQQQMILQKVLESQKALEERQNKIEDKLANLQTLMDKPSVSSPTSSSDGKRKRLVTRALSVSVLCT